MKKFFLSIFVGLFFCSFLFAKDKYDVKLEIEDLSIDGMEHYVEVKKSSKTITYKFEIANESKRETYSYPEYQILVDDVLVDSANFLEQKLQAGEAVEIEGFLDNNFSYGKHELEVRIIYVEERGFLGIDYTDEDEDLDFRVVD